MKRMLLCIIQNLINDPEKASIEEICGSQISVMQIKIPKEDIGKVIGKSGRTIDAIRVLMMAVGSKIGRRVSLEIEEPV